MMTRTPSAVALVWQPRCGFGTTESSSGSLTLAAGTYFVMVGDEVSQSGYGRMHTTSALESRHFGRHSRCRPQPALRARP